MHGGRWAGGELDACVRVCVLRLPPYTRAHPTSTHSPTRKYDPMQLLSLFVLAVGRAVALPM